jgi:hypothetical protein
VRRTLGVLAVLIGSAIAGWWWVRQRTIEYNARRLPASGRGGIYSNTPTAGDIPTVDEHDFSRMEG